MQNNVVRMGVEIAEIRRKYHNELDAVGVAAIPAKRRVRLHQRLGIVVLRGGQAEFAGAYPSLRL